MRRDYGYGRLRAAHKYSGMLHFQPLNCYAVPQIRFLSDRQFEVIYTIHISYYKHSLAFSFRARQLQESPLQTLRRWGFPQRTNESSWCIMILRSACTVQCMADVTEVIFSRQEDYHSQGRQAQSLLI